MFEVVGAAISFLALVFSYVSWREKQAFICRVEHAKLDHVHIIRFTINTGTARRRFSRLWCPGFKAWQCPRRFAETWTPHKGAPFDRFEGPCRLNWNFVRGKSRISTVDFMLIPKDPTANRFPRIVFITGTGFYFLAARIPEPRRRSRTGQ